jgi:hypothetical protein
MLTPDRSDARAWRAATIDSPDSWYYPLPEQTLSALKATIRHGRRCESVSDLQLSDDLWADGAEDFRAALETGRGWAIVQTGHIPPEDSPAVFWLVGQFLGRPMAQNVQGTLLYDVRDSGQDVRYGARFSVTNADSTFHTDNSFGDEVLDYVGLLCLNSARSGGRSQIVSGHTVWNELRARHPAAAEVLGQPFHFDRRGGLRPGEDPTARFPVFDGSGPGLLIRYLRYWIEAGHDKAGQPLTSAQLAALDRLGEVVGDPALRVEFDLRPGEMLFVNNRWIFHNRTAFEDHPEPERKRHYVRLWLQR